MYVCIYYIVVAVNLSFMHFAFVGHCEDFQKTKTITYFFFVRKVRVIRM